MKKNITVNIFGTLYPIDEDAYELLQKYNDNMRRYYSRREGGDEIADDVEMRVAELLTEYRQKGVQAITIEHITEIITRIGDPQQMDEEAQDGQTPPPPPGYTDGNFQGQTGQGGQAGPQGSAAFGATPPPYPPNNGLDKKLFRDPEDRILGGVLSGVSHYFGIKDPLILRLAMVVLFLLSFSSLAVLYVIGWILIPEAQTPEDRLRMYGKNVTAQAINEELMRGVRNAQNFVKNPKNQDTARGCLTALIRVFAITLIVFTIITIGSILIGFIAALIGGGFAAATHDFSFTHFGTEISTGQLLATIPQWLLWVCGVSAVLILLLPLYGLIRLLFTRHSKHGMNTAVRIGLVGLWVISLFTAIGSSVYIARQMGKNVSKIEKQANTRDGFYLRGESWKLLDKKGWKVAQLEGVEKDLSEWGILPEGENGDYINLEASDNPNDMHYELYQETELNPGKYRLDCWVNADGDGNVAYVRDSRGNELARVEIPKFEKSATVSKKEITEEADTDEVDEIIEDHKEDLGNWTHIEKEFVMTEKGTVVTGVTNKSEMRSAPWNSTCLGIASIKVLRNGD